jgi:2'-5' RNA ligase
MIRTFVAVELTDTLRQSLLRVQERLKRDLLLEGSQARREVVRVQWTRPESLHVTLKFLGEIDESRVEPIRGALAEALRGSHRFSVEVEGIGTFPGAGAPKVIWAGLKVNGSEHLRHLAAMVDQALTPLGFPSEERPFSPHLTLARVKDGARLVAQALRASGAYAHTSRTGSLGTLSVKHVTFMQSVLRPTGSVYTRLFTVPLADHT